MKKTLFVMLLSLVACLTKAQAEVDPNFHIYLCFGQSNMEGNAQWESQDVGVDSRFQMLATCNFTSPRRTLGNWYTAECPIVSPIGKLGPSDYFGRTMVANLPDHKIGVIAVAMGGSPIEMFDKDKYKQKLEQNPNEWWAQIAKNHYGGNPYGRLIDMAKKAQQVGVIKGILLHQGESNCGNPNWPGMVNKIYTDMLADLGLQAADVPLFAGEVEYEGVGANSGGCAGHNVQVRRLPTVIPTAYVVSAKDIPGNGRDPWHFSAQGYRILGQRYAQQVLRVAYDIDPEITEPVTPQTNLGVGDRFSALTDIKTTPFAIVNEAENKAFYCTYGQHLAYDGFKAAFKESNAGYLFKLQKTTGGFRLRLVTPDGADYQVNGGKGYLNSQNVTGDCCFISGNMNSQNGQDIAKGAVWEIQYVDGKGFSIKNVGTGKFLQSNDAAKYDEPTYFTLCTLADVATGIHDATRNVSVSSTDNKVYTFDGRRVDAAHLRPGIYVSNGRKIIVR